MTTVNLWKAAKDLASKHFYATGLEMTNCDFSGKLKLLTPLLAQASIFFHLLSQNLTIFCNSSPQRKSKTI